MFFSRNTQAGLFLSTCLFYMAFAAASMAADPVLSNAPVIVNADSVFVQMQSAWENGDEKAMAALVQHDGLRVTHGGDYDRFTTYSPDQAFYYFQDLFQTHQTKDFKFRRLPDPPDGTKGLGMVEWQYLLPGRTIPEMLKLVIVLFKDEGQWRLGEFNSISQR